MQATWCGWAASTGIKEIDYIIGDKYATPLLDQKKFTEKIYQLNKIWQCLSISEMVSKNLTVKKSKDQFVTFGSFVNIMKVDDNLIKIWSKILKNTSNTKLFLKCGAFDIPEVKEKFIKKFVKDNINENKLIIEGNVS